MTIKKIFDFSALTVTGFTVFHAMLVFLIFHNSALIDQIVWHYSDGLTWYILFIFAPLALGLLTAIALHKKVLTPSFRILLYSIVTLQVAFQIAATTISSNYWGYPFKRQSIFSEISQADKVITFSKVFTDPNKKPMTLSVFLDTAKFEKGLLGRKDPYYGGKDRILMVFEDNAHIHGNLYYIPEIYDDTTKKISLDKLNKVANSIYSSGIIDNGEMSMDFGKILNGIIVEYQTKDNEQYLFAGLAGQEISNDHHPFYEFLFKEINGVELIKKQRYYYDFAGVEGLEYTFISPLFALLLTILSIVATIFILSVRYFRQMIMRKEQDTA